MPTKKKKYIDGDRILFSYAGDSEQKGKKKDSKYMDIQNVKLDSEEEYKLLRNSKEKMCNSESLDERLIQQILSVLSEESDPDDNEEEIKTFVCPDKVLYEVLPSKKCTSTDSWESDTTKCRKNGSVTPIKLKRKMSNEENGINNVKRKKLNLRKFDDYNCNDTDNVNSFKSERFAIKSGTCNQHVSKNVEDTEICTPFQIVLDKVCTHEKKCDGERNCSEDNIECQNDFDRFSENSDTCRSITTSRSKRKLFKSEYNPEPNVDITPKAIRSSSRILKRKSMMDRIELESEDNFPTTQSTKSVLNTPKRDVNVMRKEIKSSRILKRKSIMNRKELESEDNFPTTPYTKDVLNTPKHHADETPAEIDPSRILKCKRVLNTKDSDGEELLESEDNFVTTPSTKSILSTPKHNVDVNVTPKAIRSSSRILKRKSVLDTKTLDLDGNILSESENNFPMTPSMKSVLSTPKRRLMSLTPTVSERKGILRTPTTPLDHARQLLHVSAVPKSLPCRQNEFDTIYKFLLRKIHTRSGGSMYISGVPGTGKTATVLRVMKKLELDYKDGKISCFKFVEINSLQLTEPHQAYCKFWKQLSGSTLTAEQAQKALDKKFSIKKGKKEIIVLLIDELDYLCNKRQDVIYNILDWPAKDGSQLVVLTIANTMDLPERTLKGRVTSRMGLTRLVFQPYTYLQLQTIVLNRLSGNKSFHPDAVQLAARKVASISGDARRALDICRRAIDISTAEDNGETVTIAHVEEAVNSIMSNPIVLAIKCASTVEQLVLRSINDESTRSALDMCTLDKMYDQLHALCVLEGVKVPTIAEVYYVCSTLDDSGLIMVDKKKNAGIKRKIALNVSSDDIHYALDL